MKIASIRMRSGTQHLNECALCAVCVSRRCVCVIYASARVMKEPAFWFTISN